MLNVVLEPTATPSAPRSPLTSCIIFRFPVFPDVLLSEEDILPDVDVESPLVSEYEVVPDDDDTAAVIVCGTCATIPPPDCGQDVH